MSKLDVIFTIQHYKLKGVSGAKKAFLDHHAKQAIRALILELIGEDDYEGLMQNDESFFNNVGRNKLRAELRKEVEQL